MIFQKVKDFLNKKYIKMGFRFIGYFLQIIGIVALLGVVSYQKKPKDTQFGSWQYSYELSEKAALDTWAKNTEFMNRMNPEATSSQKTLGEFRTYITKTKDQNGKEILRIRPSSEGGISGYLYMDGRQYTARIDSQTKELTYDTATTYERSNWHWYNWMGLRLPQ